MRILLTDNCIGRHEACQVVAYSEWLIKLHVLFTVLIYVVYIAIRNNVSFLQTCLCVFL
jgi:hypothetical protein